MLNPPTARVFSLSKLLLAIFMLFGLVACGGGGAKAPSTGNPPPAGATVAAIQVTTDLPELSSNGATPSTIFADVKGAGSVLLPNQPVTFTADSGALSVSSPTTDANGRASATLSTGGDKSTRTIRVTVTSGGLTQTTTIDVSGTNLTISAPSSLVINSSTILTVFLKDSAGKGIAGQNVVLTSSLGNKFTPSTATTNAAGQATINLNATNGGSETITATALGASAVQNITISPNNFAFVAPADGTEIDIGTLRAVTVHFDISGVDQTGNVTFSTTRGTPSSLTQPLVSGNATINVSSITAGIGTITASASGVSAQRNVEFVATTAALMNISASPAVVGVNTPTTTTQQSTISSQIKDATGNLVKNKTINFSIVDVTGGSLSPGTAVTDSQGIASTVYTAGTTTSAQNGVTVTATVAGTSPAVTATANLTVARQALFVDLGTDNTIRKSTSGPNYEKDYSVLVVDAARAAVKGATVTVSLTPLTYGKGNYVFITPSWRRISSIPGFPDTACLSEDRNGNGQLDPAEDTNGDGLLTPSGVATVTGSVVTDNTGFGTVTIKYPAEIGNWVKVRLEARATVAASEGTGRVDFVLPVLASDFTTETVSPPGNPSRFGTSADCGDAR